MKWSWGLLGLLVACQGNPVLEGVQVRSDLTPTSKGERLTPTSKGERIYTGTLSGRVQGGPEAAGVQVRIVGTSLQTTTAADGSFRITAAPVGVPFTLLAEAVDAQGQPLRSQSQHQIAAQTGTLALETLLLRPTGSVSGQVRLADGGDPSGTDIFIPGTAWIAKADAQGNFALPGLPEGEYRLMAYKAGYQRQESASVHVLAGQLQLLDLLTLPTGTETALGATVTGQVTHQGQPVSGAEVAVVGTDLTQSQLTLTNGQGQYQLPAPANQPIELVVSRGVYTPVVTPFTLAVGETRRQDVPLRADRLYLGRLQVRLRDCSGSPVTSALVQLSPSPAFGVLPFTDNRGQAQLGALLPGPYTVTLAKGMQRSFATVVIANLEMGSDQQPGALAQLDSVLGQPCPPLVDK